MRKPISSDVKDLRLSPPSEKMCSPTFYLCLLSYLRTNLKLKKCQKVSGLGHTSLVSSGKEPPWYQHRKGWILPLFEYFGDAGIFPEIHVADYPLDRGGRKTFRMHWPSSGIMKGKLNMMLLLNRDHPKTRALTLNTPTSFQRRSGMLSGPAKAQ